MTSPAAKLQSEPSFEILDHAWNAECDAFVLKIDSERQDRLFVVEWKFVVDSDDRLTIVKWAPSFGEYCTDDLPPNDVRELEHFLECDPRLIERCVDAVNVLRWNRAIG